MRLVPEYVFFWWRVWMRGHLTGTCVRTVERSYLLIDVRMYAHIWILRMHMIDYAHNKVQA
jgi:hypothetical protein